MSKIDLDNLDYDDTTRALEAIQLIRKHSESYAGYKELYSEAKFEFDCILASKIKEYQSDRATIGYDMVKLKVIADVPEAKEIKKNMDIYKAKCEGLERIIDALHSQISLTQSLIKIKLKEA